jgi:hypothetical protein
MKNLVEVTYLELLLTHPLYTRIEAHRNRANLPTPTEAEAQTLLGGDVAGLLALADMVNPL